MVESLLSFLKYNLYSDIDNLTTNMELHCCLAV